MNFMGIKIYENTSVEGIRRALSGFGRFSSVEIDKEENSDTNEKCFIFREVGFFGGLHRLIFKSKEELDLSREKSQIFLNELLENRPDIKKLLGSSISGKESWRVGEFRKKLKIKTDFIRREKIDDLLHIPFSSESKVGVIDAKISEIKADSIISWKMANVDKCIVTVIDDVEEKNAIQKTSFV